MKTFPRLIALIAVAVFLTAAVSQPAKAGGNKAVPLIIGAGIEFLLGSVHSNQQPSAVIQKTITTYDRHGNVLSTVTVTTAPTKLQGVSLRFVQTGYVRHYGHRRGFRNSHRYRRSSRGRYVDGQRFQNEAIRNSEMPLRHRR